MGEKEIYFYKRTIKHIANVYLNVIRIIDETDIIDKYNINVNNLLKNVRNHDRSKFKEPQYSKYVEITWYYYKQSTGENYPLSNVLSTNATILHIITEPHHPERWDNKFLLDQCKFNVSDRDDLPEKPVDGTQMPLECVIEMVCDWYSVACEKGSNLKNWADMTVNKRWLFTEEQVNLIYDLVEIFT